MDVAVQVSRAYVELLSNLELLEAAAVQREALEAEQDRVRQFLEVGKAAQVDLLRVQAALSRAEATEISVRTGLSVVRGHLGRLTGLEVSELEDRTLLPVRVRADANPGSDEARVLAQEANPELTLARHRIAAAEAGTRQARARWFPTLQVGGAINDFGALEGSHTQEWQGSVQLSYPLFTGGGRGAELRTAEAETREAREDFRLAELGVEDAVEEAEASLVEARALRAALDIGLQQAQEVARIEALALEVGSGVQTDFLRSQAELFQVRASLVQARHQEIMASIQLARVTGQLDLTWFQDNMEVVP
jgi:outer membrane protein